MALSASVYQDSSVCSKVVESQRLMGNATRLDQAQFSNGLWPHDLVMREVNTGNLVFLSMTKRGLHAISTI